MTTGLQELARLRTAVAEKDCRIGELERQMGALDREAEEMRAELEVIRASFAHRFLRRARLLLSLRQRVWGVAARKWRGLRRRLDPAYRCLRLSPLFDPSFYLEKNPDLAATGMNPLWHYLKFGAAEGREPSPLFDTLFYLGQLKGRDRPVVPLLHYLSEGAGLGLDPNPLFDSSYYLEENPDLKSCGINPLEHYIRHGVSESRDPSPCFDTSYYLEQNPDVAAAKMNPLAHYLGRGFWEGRNPNSFFESNFYLEKNPDVLEAGMNPLVHYVRFGAAEGRSPCPFFDPAFYLEKNPDVAAAGVNPLGHFLRYGLREGRSAVSVLHGLQYRPLISIVVPVYNTDEHFLRRAIGSVLNQIYRHWELCLVDDGSTSPHVRRVLEVFAREDQRVRVAVRSVNKGIVATSNEAASMASGDYLAFLDHDDELSRDALLTVVRCLNEKKADVLYSDEGFISERDEPINAHYKPDWSPDLLLSHNYVTHLLVTRRSLFNEVGGFSADCEGAQDYDLVLKLTEKAAVVRHIPQVLYFWRSFPASTSTNPEAKAYADEAGRRALVAALGRRGVAAEVMNGNKRFYYRVRRHIQGEPQVSILIPFRDMPEYLERCVTAIFERTSYQNYEIIGIDNGSNLSATQALMARLCDEDKRIRFVSEPSPFNYSRINNLGVAAARGEHVVLMNNDIEVINIDWLEALLEHSQRPEVGAVGAKLYYANNTVQHGGVIVGIGGFAGHAHRHFPRKASGHFNRLMVVQNMSAVTAALLMVKRSLFLAIGGLDERHFTVALNDVDFCLRLAEGGYSNIFTPYCEAYHYESASRGYETTSPEKMERFGREIAFFQARWREFLAAGDPCYNPNLSLDREDFSERARGSWFSSEKARTTELGE